MIKSSAWDLKLVLGYIIGTKFFLTFRSRNNELLYRQGTKFNHFSKGLNFNEGDARLNFGAALRSLEGLGWNFTLKDDLSGLKRTVAGVVSMF
jgi:hypothetical protein